jgi:hypothetical protein
MADLIKKHDFLFPSLRAYINFVKNIELACAHTHLQNARDCVVAVDREAFCFAELLHPKHSATDNAAAKFRRIMLHPPSIDMILDQDCEFWSR